MTEPAFDPVAWRNGMRRSVEKMKVRRGLMDFLLERTNDVCDTYGIPPMGGMKADADGSAD